MQDVVDVVATWALSLADEAMLMSMIYDEPRGGWCGRARKERADCGTIEGYRQHLYYKESTEGCGCREANAERKAEQRELRQGVYPRRTKPAPECGTSAAYEQHRYYGEYPIDDACAAAHSADVSKNDKIRRQQGRFKKTKPR